MGLYTFQKFGMDPDTIIIRILSSLNSYKMRITSPVCIEYVCRRIKNFSGGVWCMEGGGGKGATPPPPHRPGEQHISTLKLRDLWGKMFFFLQI